MEKEQIIFKGHRYNRYPASSKSNHRHYYGRTGGFLLHREIWSAAHGSIPYGYIIHHKDGNWLNNDISNLEAIDMRTHAARHSIEAFVRNTSPEHLEHLERIRPLTVAWHRSPEGRAWHSANAKKQTNRVKPFTKAAFFDRACAVCGTMFNTNNKKRVFCSNKCACTSVRMKRKAPLKE